MYSKLDFGNYHRYTILDTAPLGLLTITWRELILMLNEEMNLSKQEGIARSSFWYPDSDVRPHHGAFCKWTFIEREFPSQFFYDSFYYWWKTANKGHIDVILKLST